MKAFQDIVGSEHVLTGEAERLYFSRDIFFWPKAQTPRAVIAPACTTEVAAVMRAAATQGLAVVPRGGGMSYTGGYVPDTPDCVVLDLRRLDKVREIHAFDQFVTVEAGATWLSLTEALAGSGLRPIFKPPYSGVFSTVGGALSQGTADEMSGILSLEVVLADGSVLHTGSAGIAAHGSPFLRNFGPDLAGLFIADGGTLGIKTAVTIALEPVPRALGYSSFAFESFEGMVAAMVACCQQRMPGRFMGLDPRKSQNAPRVGFRDAIQTLAELALARPRLGAGLRDALSMAAAGRNFMEGVQWSMHITAEGVSERAVEDALQIYRGLALAGGAADGNGREIPNLLPMALATKPYSVRGFLGPEGERWVPTNALLPFSKARLAATRVQAYFAARRSEMERWGVWESCIVGPRHGFMLIEPSFYWRDEVSRLHLDHLDATSAARFSAFVPNPGARDFAIDLREGLKQLFSELGAAHVQLGKAYAFRSRLGPASIDAIRRIKTALDPAGLLNPGNLDR